MFFLRGGGVRYDDKGERKIVHYFTRIVERTRRYRDFNVRLISCQLSRQKSRWKSLESSNDWTPFYAIITHGKYVVLTFCNNYITNTWRHRKFWGCDSVNSSTAVHRNDSNQNNSCKEQYFFLVALQPGSLSHFIGHMAVGRTPLDEWSAGCRGLYLTTCDTQNR